MKLCTISFSSYFVPLAPLEKEFAMPHYRIYKLSSDNRIVGVPEEVEFDSDRDVITHVKAKLDGLDIEVGTAPAL